MHPPKRETFDVAARTNTDNKGIVRAVEVYTETPFGLYLSRPTPGRAQFHHLESWLLPALGLRVSVFHFSPGHERDQDLYLDVGEYARVDGRRWTGEDHYVDLAVRTGVGTTVLDVDELFAAVAAGLLDAATAERAVARTIDAVDGIAAHGHDVGRWLAGRGMPLTWRATPGPA